MCVLCVLGGGEVEVGGGRWEGGEESADAPCEGYMTRGV